MNEHMGQRLRIAYLLGSFPHVSETFIVNQISEVAARGHDVDIYTTCDGVTRYIPNQVTEQGLMQRVYPIYAAGGRARGFWRLLQLTIGNAWRAPGVIYHLFQSIRRDGLGGALRLCYASFALLRLGRPTYDIIHAQLGPYGLLALRLKEIGAIRGPIVTSFRGYDAGKDLPKQGAAYQELFAKGALFLTVSRALAQRLRDAGCPGEKIVVHHSGIRLPPRTRVRHRKADENLRVVSVGRLVEKKGIAYAIEAVSCVKHQGRGVAYTIVGDGPLRSKLEELILKRGLSAHVTITGWKSSDEVLELLRDADVLVAPSVTAVDGDEEGIPNVVKEAMAFGVPVVSTRHGGIPELVEDTFSGFLVAEQDIAALAARLVWLIEQPEIGEVLGRAGRSRIESSFDIDQLTDELIALYKEVARNESANAACADETGINRKRVSLGHASELAFVNNVARKRK